MNYEDVLLNIKIKNEKIVEQREIYWGSGNRSSCMSYKIASEASQS